MFTIFNGRSLSFDSNKPIVYGQISIEFLKHMHEFTGAKLAVFMCLCLHSNSEGYSWPKIETIKRETGYKDNHTIYIALNELCEMKIEGKRILSREKDTVEGSSYMRNRYRIFPDAQSTSYKPDDDLPDDEYGFDGESVTTSKTTNNSKSSKNVSKNVKKPYVENPHTEKPYVENPHAVFPHTNYIHEINNSHIENNNQNKTILSFSAEKANRKNPDSVLVPESMIVDDAVKPAIQSDNDYDENFSGDPFSDTDWHFWEQEVLNDNPPEDLFNVDIANEILTSLGELSQTRDVNALDTIPQDSKARLKARTPQESCQNKPMPQMLFQELTEGELTPAKGKSNSGKKPGLKPKSESSPELESSISLGHKELMNFLHDEVGPYRDGGRQAKEVNWLLKSGFTVEECKACLLHMKMTWAFGRISWIQVAEHISSWKARRSSQYQQQKETFQAQPEQRKKPRLAL